MAKKVKIDKKRSKYEEMNASSNFFQLANNNKVFFTLK